jgi:hypothetical protein
VQTLKLSPFVLKWGLEMQNGRYLLMLITAVNKLTIRLPDYETVWLCNQAAAALITSPWQGPGLHQQTSTEDSLMALSASRTA